jgi:hypothetical protein
MDDCPTCGVTKDPAFEMCQKCAAVLDYQCGYRKGFNVTQAQRDAADVMWDGRTRAEHVRMWNKQPLATMNREG